MATEVPGDLIERLARLDPATMAKVIAAAEARYGDRLAASDLRDRELLTQAAAAPAGSMSCKLMLRVVVAVTGVPADELARSRTRHEDTLKARQILHWACRHHGGKSIPQIGAALGFDHTSILHNHRRVEKERARIPGAANDDIATTIRRLWEARWHSNRAGRRNPGIRTPEGIERASAASKRYWAEYRANRSSQKAISL